MSDKTKFKILKFLLKIHQAVILDHKEWRYQLQKLIEKRLPIFELFLGVLAIISLIYTQGFQLSEEDLVQSIRYDRYLATIYSILILVKLYYMKWSEMDWREYVVDLFFLAIIFFILAYRVFFLHEYDFDADNKGWTAYIVIVQVSMIIASLVSLSNNRSYWMFFTANSTVMILGSLVSIIFIGTILLKLPEASTQPITWLDAFFTTTSAVCVTGLAPFNISEVLTFKGQVILMILFQIGGLGIVTLTTFIALTIQKGVKTKEEVIIQDIMEADNISTSSRILRGIIIITFTVEAIGAFFLYLAWGDLGLSTFERVFVSVFHSVSAFCNAGFSNFPEGLQGADFAKDWFSGGVVMLLIIIGGLGFRTYREIVSRKKQYRRHLSLQSRISLQATIVLIIVGTAGIFVTDIDYWMSKDSWSETLFQTLFTSVTCRTAGFSVVEIGDLSSASVMMMILLMYIGGAPNSTAGGIKVTTVTLLFSYFWAQIKGRDHVHIGWNTIQDASLRRAVIVFMMSILMSFVSIFILTITETHLKPEDVTFEFFSALGTAGLSRGITADISAVGKIVLAIVMFSGKIGLFTLISLLGEDEKSFEYRYPESSILVG
ncbi:potassium transporter TrkG [Flammeovirga sp. SubArs3]|uniref:TrkH family potassium uptake protein n=1 Tax=Flammeovirga sp. SubArs3 TaxID=2995316 RepID=UPI00248CD3E4|nr:potassium transporter TrkG [Flammeovirga sp. SubArs3]